MKVHLLFADRDLDVSAPLPPQAQALCDDLELQAIFDAMAGTDEAVRASVQAALLCPLTEAEPILRRQAVLQDCLAAPQPLQELYALAGEALNAKNREGWWPFSACPASELYSSVQLLQYYHGFLVKLHRLALENQERFRSEGLRALCDMLCRELDDAFLAASKELLEELNFKDGTLIEVHLGPDLRTEGYRLVRRNPRKFRLRWAFAPAFTLEPQDTSGSRDLAGRRDLACLASVDVLADAAAHIEDFFRILRDELAFYVGAVRLWDTMQARGIPCCIPGICPEGPRRVCTNLQDLSLALRVERCVGNDLDTEGQRLYLITGANQGGKTTFLRSIGQAQLMMQGGLFAAAQQFEAHLCPGLFTHFKREEDEGLHSGKLDEELRRMDAIVPHLQPGSLLLLNESFASTNEREGSELCHQITLSFLEHGIEQFHVSHLFTFTHGFYEQHRPGVVFLRAERPENGQHSFLIREGEPMQRTLSPEDLEPLPGEEDQPQRH